MSADEDKRVGKAGVLGIGYEGMTADQFMQKLLADEVAVVFDVRLNPVSRKAGFSKRGP